MMRWTQKGEGKGGVIFGIAVLLLATYIGFKVIPVMIRVYAFEDRTRETCKFLRGRSLEQLEKDIVGIGKVEDLPIQEENIEVDKIRVDTYMVLRAKVNYSVPISTPITVFNWERKFNYEAPIFE